MTEINYEILKASAKKNGVKVTDLIALAPGNDPFYCGQPAQQKEAEWFACLFDRFDFPAGVHLRRVHYKLVSQEEPVLMTNGKAYENTEPCWKRLAQASKPARYLGLVDMDAFDDRRNPAPIVFEPAEFQLLSVWTDYEIDVSAQDMPAMPSVQTTKPDTNQRYLVEIWCEKSTMNDILLPLCERYKINLVTGLGELSITAVRRMHDRIKEAGKPVRIFYISDYDPAGLSMPVAVARKAEFFINQDQPEPVDMKLYPIVLTADQVREYKLPRIPIKESERRKDVFEARHGEGATELDALEAIHPGEFKRIVETAVNHYRDENLSREIRGLMREVDDKAEQVEHDVTERYALELREAENEWQGISEQIEAWTAEYAPLWGAISEAMAEAMPSEWEMPEAEEVADLPDPLFDSEREYGDQIITYKRFQGKFKGTIK